jgi:peroxiredoxin
MKRPGKLIIATLALVAVLGAAVAAFTRSEAAPEVRFTNLAGGSFTTSELRGKVVLVNFWATDCTTCMHEMPKMVETYNKFAPRGYEMVAVAMSYDHPNFVAAYAQKNRLPFKVALDVDGTVAREFGNVRVTPTTYLLDKRGRVLKQYLGEPDWAEFHALLDRALAEPA